MCPPHGRPQAVCRSLRFANPWRFPDLLALQTESFDWLLGNERWQARVAAAKEAGRTDVPDRSAWRRSSRRSPIEDFSGSMSLSFRDHRFEETRKTIESCKSATRPTTRRSSSPEFMNTNTGEIKSQTVFMGDFPLMTERARSSSTAPSVSSSPAGPQPGRLLRAHRRQDLRQGRLHGQGHPQPWRTWLEFEIDKRDMVGVRVDRKRKQSVTVLLKALGWTNDQILEEFGDYESMRLTLEKDHTAGQDDALLDIYRKLRPGEPPTKEAARACSTTSTSTASATTSPRSAATS